MSKIVGYMICHNGDIEHLEKDVNELIGQGWEPIGNLTTLEGSAIGAYSYIREMVKYAEPEPQQKEPPPLYGLRTKINALWVTNDDGIMSGSREEMEAVLKRKGPGYEVCELVF